MARSTISRAFGAVVLAAVAVLGRMPQPTAGGGGGNGYVDVPPGLDRSVDLRVTRSTRTSRSRRRVRRGELVVLFNGTGAGPNALAGMELRARLGRLPRDRAALRLGCRRAVGLPDSAITTDPDCHPAFRAEVVFGAGW